MSNETEKAKGLKDNEVDQSEVDGVVSHAVRPGRNYIAFAKFMQDILSGKESIILAEDYVVITRKKFAEMQEAIKEAN